MNSLANGRLFDRTDVEEVYIQAAAGDAGTALGAALYVHHAVLGAPRDGFVMEHSYWGPRLRRGRDPPGPRRGAPRLEGRDGAWDGIRIETVARRGRAWRPRPPRRSPAAPWSAGTRGARSGGRAPSATARSWPIPGGPT